MRSFDEIFAIAVERKGGQEALEALLTKPLSPQALAARPDSDWLSAFTKCVFQAGFNWRVIEAKWSGFADAFDGFAPQRVARYTDEDVDRLLADTRIVRNIAKIRATIENAVLVEGLAREHGSASAFFGASPARDYVGLLEWLETRGARLGGTTGQRALRSMGCPSFILTPDVTARLVAEEVIAKSPSSKRDMAAVQEAFNRWSEQSGRSLTEISQALAMSVGN